MATVRVMSEQYPSTTAPKSNTTRSPSAIVRSVGRACGSAPLGPEATIVSNEFPDAPCLRIAVSRASANSASLGRSRSDGDAVLFGERDDLAGVLADTQRLDDTAGRDELAAIEQPLIALLSGPHDRVGFQADPRRTSHDLRNQSVLGVG